MSMYTLVSPGGETRQVAKSRDEYVKSLRPGFLIKLSESEEREYEVLSVEESDGLLVYTLGDGYRLVVDRSQHPAWVGSDVEGLWLHVVHEDQDVAEIQIPKLDGEICVSSLYGGGVYGCPRRGVWVGLVFEGTVSNLYSQDSYSYVAELGKRHPSDDGAKAPEVNEGFLTPSRAKVVAVATSRLEHPDAQRMAKALDVPIVLVKGRAEESCPFWPEHYVEPIQDSPFRLPFDQELLEEILVARIPGLKARKVWNTSCFWDRRFWERRAFTDFRQPADLEISWDLGVPGTLEFLQEFLPELWEV